MAGFVGGAVATGSLKGALRGAFSGAVFGGIGSAGWGTEATLGAHAVSGGLLSDLQGGSFGHGFWTAGIMKGVGMVNSPAAGASISQIAGRAVVQAMVGGTLSKVTGGKFANGAITSAIQFTVNASSTAIQDTWGDFVSASKSFFSDIARGLKTSALGLAFSLTGSTPEWKYLYRVVGGDELAKIQASGQFQLNEGSGFSQKQFWTNITSARAYMGNTTVQKWETSKSLSIVEARVSQETFNMGQSMTLDSMPAVSYTGATLPFVNADTIKYCGISVRDSIKLGN